MNFRNSAVVVNVGLALLQLFATLFPGGQCEDRGNPGPSDDDMTLRHLEYTHVPEELCEEAGIPLFRACLVIMVLLCVATLSLISVYIEVSYNISFLYFTDEKHDTVIAMFSLADPVLGLNILQG